MERVSGRGFRPRISEPRLEGYPQHNRGPEFVARLRSSVTSSVQVQFFQALERGDHFGTFVPDTSFFQVQLSEVLELGHLRHAREADLLALPQREFAQFGQGSDMLQPLVAHLGLIEREPFQFLQLSQLGNVLQRNFRRTEPQTAQFREHGYFPHYHIAKDIVAAEAEYLQFLELGNFLDSRIRHIVTKRQVLKAGQKSDLFGDGIIDLTPGDTQAP